MLRNVSHQRFQLSSTAPSSPLSCDCHHCVGVLQMNFPVDKWMSNTYPDARLPALCPLRLSPCSWQRWLLAAALFPGPIQPGAVPTEALCFPANDFGLFLSDEDPKKGIWLEAGKALDYYMLRNGVSAQPASCAPRPPQGQWELRVPGARAGSCARCACRTPWSTRRSSGP